jgi:hypothetical protein
MQEKEESGSEQWLIDVSLVLLVGYNTVFLVDVMLGDGQAGRWAHHVMAFIDQRRGWVTLFEAIAALSIFVDLVVRFDAYEQRRRNLRVTCVALSLAGFVFKAFTFYLDSAYLE